MAKRAYALTEKKIAARFKEGRGSGAGADYLPFLTMHDFSSKGRVCRFAGATTGRTHHFLSDLEVAVGLNLDWEPAVLDIREQYPLDRAATILLAEAAGIPHPSTEGVDIVMTTDFLVDYAVGPSRFQVAISAKYANEIEDPVGGPRVIAKLELERRYWAVRSVRYVVVTDREVPKVRTRTLLWLNEWLSLEGLAVPHVGFWEQRCAVLLAALAQAGPGRVADLFGALEAKHGWAAGEALSAFRHLAANRRVSIDVGSAFDVRGPLAQVSVPAERDAARAA